jgi:YD repeat-containing protein
LKAAKGPSGYSAAFTYSATGNILSAKVGGPESVNPHDVTYAYADKLYAPHVDAQAVNALRNVSNGEDWASYVYDAAGNVSERNVTGDTTHLSWDGDDQLVEVSRSGQDVERYFYDHTVTDQRHRDPQARIPCIGSPACPVAAVRRWCA